MNNMVIIIDDTECSNWKNAVNTGNKDASKAECNSWKEFWIKYSGREWPDSCSHEGCNKKAEDGAHLIKSNSSNKFGNKQFVVPMCKEHNPRTSVKINPCFNLKIGTAIVRANVELQMSSNDN